MIGCANAQASWGPDGECHWSGTHCYAEVDWRPKQEKYAAIDYVDTTLSDVTELKEGRNGFDDGEEWVLWPGSYGSKYWVETGSIVGSNRSSPGAEPPEYGLWDEYNPHEFDAISWSGGFFLHIDQYTVPQQQYTHYLIEDVEHNGVYRVYWGGAGTGACEPTWCEVNAFGEGAGFPKRYSLAEAGSEIATEYNEPYDDMRQTVAASESVGNNTSNWEAWSGATREQSNGWMTIETNPELPAAGDIAWNVGPEYEGDVVGAGADASLLSGMSEQETALGSGNIRKEVRGDEDIFYGSEPFKIETAIPQGATPPTGDVLTLVHNSEGVFEDEYLGDHPLSEEELKNLYGPKPLRKGFKQP